MIPGYGTYLNRWGWIQRSGRFRGLDAEAESAGLFDGQWQLMGLARTLYGNPRILLLDEFTAHVDTKTEWMLYQTLAKMKGQYTCIVISHRHMNMDNIHVIEL